MSASKTSVERIKSHPDFKAGKIDMITLAGGVLLQTHGPAICSPPCAVHKPSQHAMTDWPLNWRDDRSLFERLCPHGIGHPDPDSVQYRMIHFQESSTGVHGCDGCCK